MSWLPKPTYQERRQTVLSRTPVPSSLRLSEFLVERNILFFRKETSKGGIAEALVRSFPAPDPDKTLKEMWSREADGALLVPPRVAILRARLAGLLHVQAALGVSPSQVVVVLLTPAERFRIHLKFLVEIASLFRDAAVAETLTRLASPWEALRILREAEALSDGPPSFWRELKRFAAGLLPLRALS